MDHDPETWTSRDDFLKGVEVIKNMKVTNDHAKSAVALVQHHMHDEDQLQFLLPSYISIGDSFLTATSPPWQQLHKLYSVKMNVEQYCRKSVLNLLLFMLNLWNYRISFFAQKSWKWWPKAVSSSFHSRKYHVWLSLKQQWKYKKDIFCLFICSTCWCQGNY